MNISLLYIETLVLVL